MTTTARDTAADPAKSPADAVWSLHRRNGASLRLADLASTVVDGRRDGAV